MSNKILNTHFAVRNLPYKYTCIYTKIRMYTEKLILNIWKQPKLPLIYDRLHRSMHSQKMEYSATMKFTCSNVSYSKYIDK